MSWPQDLTTLLKRISTPAEEVFKGLRVLGDYNKTNIDALDTVVDTHDAAIKAAIRLLGPGLRGEEYWVAKNGNDSNDGLSSAAPFLTIGAAITASNANIALAANVDKNNTIFIGGGTYTENITTGAKQCDLIGLDLNRSGWSPRIAGKIAVVGVYGMRLFNLQVTQSGEVPTVELTDACHNFEMHNCEIRMAGSTTYGFHLNGDSFYVKIKDCRFTTDHNYGIYIEKNCKALQIINNWIAAKTCGIYVKAGVTTSFDSIIKGNVITRSTPTTTDPLATGIDMADLVRVPHIMIVGNWIAATDGIHFGHADENKHWQQMNCIDNHIVTSADGVGAIETLLS